jgi:hypothetical protein
VSEGENDEGRVVQPEAVPIEAGRVEEGERERERERQFKGRIRGLV